MAVTFVGKQHFHALSSWAYNAAPLQSGDLLIVFAASAGNPVHTLSCSNGTPVKITQLANSDSLSAWYIPITASVSSVTITSNEALYGSVTHYRNAAYDGNYSQSSTYTINALNGSAAANCYIVGFNRYSSSNNSADFTGNENSVMSTMNTATFYRMSTSSYTSFTYNDQSGYPININFYLKDGSLSNIKYWNGTAFANAKQVNVWNGSAWVKATPKRFDGTNWVNIP